MATTRAWAGLATIVCAVVVAGCGGEDSPTPDPGTGGATASGGTGGGGGGTGGAPIDPCTTDFGDLPEDPVSFRSDVLPAFHGSCSLSSSCHGGNAPKADLLLGLTSPMAMAGETLTEAAIVGIRMALLSPSKTAPEVARVVPEQPGTSFLVQKMMGNQNDHGHACALQAGAPPGSPPCGTEMAPGSPLCESSVQRFVTIAAWIDQGAQDN